MRRSRPPRRLDKKIFKKTAGKTLSINVRTPKVGGTRL